jgi:SNF2 family DNA or RNA helicase
VQLLGGDSADARDAAERAFQTPGGPQLLVASTRVAGHGLTLTRASNVCFLELEWTPAAHDQAEDRVHRIGQHDGVTAWYLLAADTIDETISQVLARKRGTVGAITDGERGDRGALVEAVIAELRGETWRALRAVS